jgi:hypothetical protein
VRLRVRRDEARAAQAAEDERERIRWSDRGLEDAVPPVVMLIWVYALSFILTLILEELRYRAAAPRRGSTPWSCGSSPAPATHLPPGTCAARCAKMIDSMQKHHPQSLPRLRGELSQEIS